MCIRDRYQGLAERYASLFGPQAPLLDTYAAGVYDGLHLVAALASDSALRADRMAPATARELAGVRRDEVHLALADGFDFSVVTGVA